MNYHDAKTEQLARYLWRFLEICAKTKNAIKSDGKVMKKFNSLHGTRPPQSLYYPFLRAPIIDKNAYIWFNQRQREVPRMQ